MLRPTSPTVTKDEVVSFGFIFKNQMENFQDHSPALSAKIRIPKKQYSVEDPLRRLPTPMFDKVMISLKLFKPP